MGTTRLADLTGLDRLGVPVWQAVRPASRALSVHQGKGFCPECARRGALMEAIESGFAEQWRRIDRTSAWAELPLEARSHQPDDWATRRGAVCAEDPLTWTLAEPLGDHSAFYVPFGSVSLDLTQSFERGVRRSSDGQAAHLNLNDAIATGLRELIERDSRACHQWLPLAKRMRCRIALDSIPYGWFRDLRGLIEDAAIQLQLFSLAAIRPFHVICCEMVDLDPFSRARAVTGGASAHECAERALEGAVLEAIQSRATILSGSRDDLPLRPAARTGPERPRATLPLPPNLPAQAFPSGEDRELSQEEIVTSINAAGFDQVGMVRLSDPSSPIVVVKTFVAGLAGGERQRRMLD